jgi:hypothetical protein
MCRYGINCKAYQRLIKGGTRLDDRTHTYICAHPGRGRAYNNENTLNTITFGSSNSWSGGAYLYMFTHGSPTYRMDLNSLKHENENLEGLIREVISNNFENDLTTPEGNKLSDIAM